MGLLSRKRTPVQRAARTLRRIDPVQTRDGVVRDANVARREDAAAELGAIEGAEAAEALFAALDDPVDSVRAAVVAALRVQGAQAAPATLARRAPAWDRAAFPASRSAGWVLVGESDGGALVDLVGALLQNAEAQPAEVEAFEAVGHVASRASGRALLSAARAATTALSGRPAADRDDAIVGTALEIALRMGGHGVPAFVELAGDEDPAVRAAAIEILGVLGDDQALSVLEEALASEPLQVRRAAAHALGGIFRADAIASLEIAASDRDPDVRRLATQSLAQLMPLRPAVEHAPALLGAAEGDGDDAALEADVNGRVPSGRFTR